MELLASLAVFLLPAVDAVLPAGSELVLVHWGAVASGAFAGLQLSLFGKPVASPAAAFATVVVAGAAGYLLWLWVG